MQRLLCVAVAAASICATAGDKRCGNPLASHNPADTTISDTDARAYATMVLLPERLDRRKGCSTNRQETAASKSATSAAPDSTKTVGDLTEQMRAKAISGQCQRYHE